MNQFTKFDSYGQFLHEFGSPDVMCLVIADSLISGTSGNRGSKVDALDYYLNLIKENQRVGRGIIRRHTEDLSEKVQHLLSNYGCLRGLESKPNYSWYSRVEIDTKERYHEMYCIVKGVPLFPNVDIIKRDYVVARQSRDFHRKPDSGKEYYNCRVEQYLPISHIHFGALKRALFSMNGFRELAQEFSFESI